MSRGCANPLWPCAMVGAVAALSACRDIGVVVHGSSACYYYADAAVPGPVQSTMLVQDEVIFGAGDRLREVVGDLSDRYERIAVVNTCVPSVMGEDITDALDGYDVMVIDAPGFCGNLEVGWRRALDALTLAVDNDRQGVNIDGLCTMWPGAAGDRMEAESLIRRAGLSVAAVIPGDSLESVRHAAPVSLLADPDMASGTGTAAGSLLGLVNLREAFENLGNLCEDADVTPVLAEIQKTEEEIFRACGKYIRRHDPPRVALFGTYSQTAMVADLLKKSLDAEIACIGVRNAPPERCRHPVVQTTDRDIEKRMILEAEPDLIIGSSFEHALSPETLFVGLTYPLRGRVRLHHRPLIGTEGARAVMEEILNVCAGGGL